MSGPCPEFWSWSCLDHWQSLAAGLLGLLAGAIAFAGAILAARRQVRAVEAQSAAAEAARSIAEQRSRHAVTAALLLEAGRVQREVLDRQKNGFPSEPVRWSRMRRQDALISTSPLIRFERPEIALLADERQGNVHALASALDRFNSHLRTLPEGTDGILIDERALKLLDELLDETMPILRW